MIVQALLVAIASASTFTETRTLTPTVTPTGTIPSATMTATKTETPEPGARMPSQFDTDAKLPNGGAAIDDRFRLWGYATGLTLMIAGELMRGPRPVSPHFFGGVSSLGQLSWACPSPVSLLGIFVFTFSLRTCGGRSREEA